MKETMAVWMKGIWNIATTGWKPCPRAVRQGGAVLCLAIFPLLHSAQGAETQTGESPVKMTAEQDHARMMQTLGIERLRPGADGWKKDAPNAANYDESKVDPHIPLPDPLVLEKRRGRHHTRNVVETAATRNRRGLRPRDLRSRTQGDPAVNWRSLRPRKRLWGASPS
jgi:hypothetical protein